MTELQQLIKTAHDWIANQWPKLPRFGIVLGTGAGIVADEIEAEETFPYGDIPGFPHSTAIGHKGQLVCGSLAGQPIVAMQGRFHLYEGYEVDRATLAIDVMHAMGVETLFISNASGGINPKYSSGEIMLIDSHIDLMNRVSHRPATSNGSPALLDRPISCTDRTYDAGLMDGAMAHARRENFVLHRGVYAAMLGPTYETRAEYRMLKKIGADVAGMSTVPEVNACARNNVRVLAMSIISNVAKPDVLESTSGQEVIDAAEVAAPRLKSIVVDAMQA